MLYALALLLAALSSYLILRPWFSPATSSAGDNTVEELHHVRDTLLHNLRELELDYSTGKIVTDEYAATKNDFSLELSAVYKKIDNLRP